MVVFWNAKNGRVKVGGADMDYVVFGKGSDVLIMLPGLGDGLVTVRGMAALLAVTYRMYAEKYRVYILSRKTPLTTGYTTKDMATDYAKAMKKLGIFKAKAAGFSQGGMIAQHLAADYPELVEKLVLAVTLPKPDKMTKEAVGNWIKLAKQGDYKRLMIDTAEKSYTEKYLKKYRLLYPFLGLAGKPKDFTRFLIQADSCIRHDASAKLEKIVCPVLIIGGGRDRIAGREAAVRMAEKIRDSRLYIYEELGHAAYEEAKDFHQRVMDFLERG